MRNIFIKGGIALIVLALLTNLAIASELSIGVSPEPAIQGVKIIITVTEDGTPLWNVFLQFSIDEGTPIYAVTNASGQAVFKPEIAGTLKIVTMKDGLMSTCKYITVNPSPTPTPTPTPPGGDGGDGISYWWSGSVTLSSGTFTKVAVTQEKYTR